MRLAAMLLAHPPGAMPATFALAALMCFNTARLPGRIDASGQLYTLAEQDRAKWDQTLVADGLTLLDRSATGAELTPYHLEAAIASLHTCVSCAEDTDWDAIVSLYDILMAGWPSPIVALNRAIAIGQRDGAERGLDQISAIDGRERLSAYPFYPAALGELELRSGRYTLAHEHFETARSTARNPVERRFFAQRVAACEEQAQARQAPFP
jgi:predicted RNA polymerase sigma factor